jgi:hypothetical protein
MKSPKYLRRKREMLEASELTQSYTRITFLYDPNGDRYADLFTRRSRISEARKSLLASLTKEFGEGKFEQIKKDNVDDITKEKLASLVAPGKNQETFITNMLLMGYELRKLDCKHDYLRDFAIDITFSAILSGTLDTQKNSDKIVEAMDIVRNLLVIGWVNT